MINKNFYIKNITEKKNRNKLDESVSDFVRGRLEEFVKIKQMNRRKKN